MKNLTNILLAVLIVLSVGLYFKKSVVNVSNPQMITQAVGDVNTTPRMIQTGVSLASTTPLSMLNSSGGDRLITSVDYYFGSMTTSLSNATGLTNLIFTMGTSTDQYIVASTNYVLNTSVATSSGPVYVASTTPGNSATVTTRVWANGTYLNLFQNGTSTPTGIVTVRYQQL